eukprot:TRINITY_DN20558_c0_g3_i1.p1 TRINITY_DN20558_c0_g3~~TRINITY_DN20558_c0_g3_i1.p1  ORF type:complete len:1320 (-),score=271.03 TRINITY_DN20558_c0_g3_i1:245-4204(-)
MPTEGASPVAPNMAGALASASVEVPEVEVCDVRVEALSNGSGQSGKACCGSAFTDGLFPSCHIKEALEDLEERVHHAAESALTAVASATATIKQAASMAMSIMSGDINVVESFNASRESFHHVLQKWVKRKTVHQVEELLKQLQPLILKALEDPAMPKSVEKVQERAVRTAWRKVHKEICKRLVSLLDSKDEDEVIDDEPGVDVVRRTLRYGIRPCDKSVWGCLGNPVWIMVTLILCCPVIEVSAAGFFLIFITFDFGDTYQCVYFILKCKAIQFLVFGALVPLILYFQYFRCVTTPLDGFASGHSCSERGPGFIVNFWSNFAAWCFQNFLTWLVFVRVLCGMTENKGEAYRMRHLVSHTLSHSSTSSRTQVVMQRRLRNLFLYDLFAFSLCAAAVFLVMQMRADVVAQQTWLRVQTLIAFQVVYAILAIVFAVLMLPGARGLVTHAEATGYDMQGRTRPLRRRKRKVDAEDPSAGNHLLKILQPVSARDVYELISKVLAILSGQEIVDERFARYSVKICMIGAEGLRGADLTGTSDCYAICQVPGKKEKIRTEVIGRTCDPHWGCEGTVSDMSAGDMLSFSVWDKDQLRDDFLGRVALTPAQFKDGFEGKLRLDKAGRGVEAYLNVRVAAPELIKDAAQEEAEKAKAKAEAAEDAAGGVAAPLLRAWRSVSAVVGGWNEKIPKVQSLLEVWWKHKTFEHVLEIVELIPSILKRSLDDPLMPRRVYRGMELTVDKSWPDLRAEIMHTIMPMIDKKEECEQEEEVKGQSVDCVRAYWRYRLFPNDKTFWQCARDPFYVTFMLVSLCPGLTYLSFLILFFVVDKTDEYQLIAFMMQFKGTQFISQGLIAMLLGYFTYFSCLTVELLKDAQWDGTTYHACEVSGPGMNATFWVNIGGMLLQIVLVWVSFLALPFAEEKARPELGGIISMARVEGGNMKSGGYIRYLVYWDGIVFLACAVGMVLRMSTREWQLNDWISRQTAFTCQFVYAICALPFFIFSLPGLSNILTHVVPSAYDKDGRCCAYAGPPAAEKKDEESGAAAGGLQLSPFFQKGEVQEFFKEVRDAVFHPGARSVPVIVNVKIRGARGLRAADVGGASDPYCTCEIAGRPNTKVSTGVIDNVLNPNWEFETNIAEYNKGESLVFTVWDDDGLQQDDVIGSFTLDSHRFASEAFDAEVQLDEAGDGVEAFLNIAVSILPRDPITVTIISAKGLRNADVVGYSDPYCVCGIVNKEHTRFQTQFVKDSLNPHWDHTAPIWDREAGDALEFFVWDDDIGADDLLGTAVLSCEQLAGGDFEGDLPLDEGPKGRKDGGATLRVRVTAVK